MSRAKNANILNNTAPREVATSSVADSVPETKHQQLQDAINHLDTIEEALQHLLCSITGQDIGANACRESDAPPLSEFLRQAPNQLGELNSQCHSIINSIQHALFTLE